MTPLITGPVDQTQLRVLLSFVAAARALTALPAFKNMRAAAQAEKHCVRCHATYTEGENAAGACTIPHIFSSDGDFAGRVIGYDKVYEYNARCCTGVTLEEEGAGNGRWLDLDELDPCYSGRHTSTVKNVKYNSANIVPCKLDATGECTEETREWDESEPFFG